MAAEEGWNWKAWFRELVVEAEGLCRPRISLKIVYARGFLQVPMHAAAAEDALTILQLPEQALENTPGDLDRVTALLGSAKELARRGSTAYAPDPLPSILGLPNATAVQRNASQKARDARMLAIEAHHAMELCCDRLLSFRLLLHCPLLPGVDGVIDHNRAEAYELLATAKDKVDACAALAAAPERMCPPPPTGRGYRVRAT